MRVAARLGFAAKCPPGQATRTLPQDISRDLPTGAIRAGEIINIAHR